MIELYGLEKFSGLKNWFNNYLTIILFILIIGVFAYLFYKQNFCLNKYSYSGANHYVLNFLLIVGTGFGLTFVGNYLSNIDSIYSLIITVLFYSANIFVLTLILIFIRRHKLKQWTISKAELLNTGKITEYEFNLLRSDCEDAGHAYTDLLLQEIKKYDLKSKSNKTISLDKYKNINIWEDRNMNLNI